MHAICDQEARKFLEALFTGGKALADAHPGIFTSEKTFRPTAESNNARSSFVLRRCYSAGEERFTLLSSGISAPKSLHILHHLQKAITSTPKLTAIDDMGNPVDPAINPSHIAHLNATFPGGQTMCWTVMSGISISCANKGQFQSLCDTFTAPARTASAAR